MTIYFFGMADHEKTIDEIAKALLVETCESIVLAALFEEKMVRKNWGPATDTSVTKTGEMLGRPMLLQQRGLDIYGQEKPTEAKYYPCQICQRKVAANRFASHVAKCSVRGRRARPGTYV